MLIAESITAAIDRKTIFHELSLKCTGGAYCILGKNGEGKSTLLKSLAGGLKPESGRITVDGIDLYAGNKQLSRSQIGYLPERPELYDFLTAREFLDFVASVKRLAIGAYMDMAQNLNISNCLNNRMDALSNGQRRKVTLICSLLNDPKYLILDEPTNAFDKEAVTFIKNVINDYLHMNRVVIFSTHEQKFAAEFGQNVYVLSNGVLHSESSTSPYLGLETD